MYEDAGFGRVNGCVVEFKLTVDLGPGIKVRVYARSTHQVEGKEVLRK